MARVRCNSCQGEYDDIGEDGVPYFHACPPITTVRVTRAGERQRIDVRDLRPDDLIGVRRGSERLEIPAGELRAEDQREGDDTRRRPDERDENTARAGGDEETDRTTGRKRRIRARGKGITVIDDGRSRNAP